MRHLTFLLYTLAWQAFVWGACWVAVMERGHSGWWILLAVFFSAAQYGPGRWAELDK